MKKYIEQVKRITIVGGPGTGKTTLAKKLGKIFDLPVIHIDAINYKPNWEEIGRENRDKLILEKIKDEEWIIDGNYSATLKERIEKSDLIIWLDYSSFDIIKGVFYRYIKNFHKEKQEIPGCKERIDWKFFKYVITYRKRARKKIVEKIKNTSKDKVCIFKNRSELDRWVENIAYNYKNPEIIESKP